MNTKGPDSIIEFNLSSEVKELESRKPWPQGLTSKTLLKSGDLRIVLIAMESAAKMQEHHSDGRISIHALSGSIRVHVQQQERILRAGHLIALDRSVKHDVEAMEDSVFLLTIAWPTEQELRGMKHRGYGS
jgi:quercetin dioxygenase-like cupin family protein